MLEQQNGDKLHSMKMSAMADAYERQRTSKQMRELGFDERFGMLIDAEWSSRQDRKLTRRLQVAKLRYQASVEDIDFKARRGLKRDDVITLGRCDWIREHNNLIITGPTGVGKSYIACALAERACRSGLSVMYRRMPRLLHELHVARGDGSYGRLVTRLTKTQLLVLDDWLLSPLTDPERRDLLEVVEDRYQRTSTLVTSQLPVTAWHEALGEPTHADAICDRLIHAAYRLELKGASMRQIRAQGAKKK